MIFMNFLSRSSRATGPKMRVPFGFSSLSMMTTALLSNRRYEPSLRADDLPRAHDHRVMHLALLHRAVRRGVLDVDLDDVADAGVRWLRPSTPMAQATLAPVLSATSKWNELAT